MEAQDAMELDEPCPSSEAGDDDGLTSQSVIIVGQDKFGRGGKQEVHPLFNWNILNTLFSHLDWEDLKLARKSCQFWNKAAIIPLQKMTKIRIYYSGDDENESTCCGGPSSSRDAVLSDFLEYADSVGSSNIFFRNFELVHWNFHHSKLDVNRFWNACGQHIRGLHLKHCCFGSEIYVRNVFFTRTSNMEELELEGVGFCSPIYQYVQFPTGKYSSRRRAIMDNTIPTPVLELVSDNSDENEDGYPPSPDEELVWHCNCDYEWSTQKDMKPFRLEQLPSNPNLKSFVTDCRIPLRWKDIVRVYKNLEILDVTDGDGVANQLLRVLADFKQRGIVVLPKLSELRVFHFRMEFPEGVAENLKLGMQLNYPIKKFKLNHEISHCTSESQILVVHYIEKLLKNNLEVLRLENGFERSLFPPPTASASAIYPKLKNLTSYAYYLTGSDFDCLRSVPCLKELHLSDGSSNEVHRLTSMRINQTLTTIVLPSLVKLSILSNHFLLTRRNIHQLSQWFPNLKDFTGFLTDDVLLAIADGFGKRLVQLEFFSNSISDRGFTGDSDESNNVDKENGVKPAKQRRMSNGEAEPGFANPAGIRKMIKLKHLKMAMDDSTVANLTDSCIYNGFIHMPELRTLVLCEEHHDKSTAQKFKLSKKALKDLCDRRNLHLMSTPKYYRSVVEGDCCSTGKRKI